MACNQHQPSTKGVYPILVCSGSGKFFLLRWSWFQAQDGQRQSLTGRLEKKRKMEHPINISSQRFIGQSSVTELCYSYADYTWTGIEPRTLRLISERSIDLATSLLVVSQACITLVGSLFSWYTAQELLSCSMAFILTPVANYVVPDGDIKWHHVVLVYQVALTPFT